MNCLQPSSGSTYIVLECFYLLMIWVAYIAHANVSNVPLTKENLKLPIWASIGGILMPPVLKFIAWFTFN